MDRSDVAGKIPNQIAARYPIRQAYFYRKIIILCECQQDVPLVVERGRGYFIMNHNYQIYR
ncbi:hypothetical protein JY23_05815 [Neisseria meningitidis]|nr:hypothetical protein JY23_05815 [Neisseria meningitidis]